LNWYGKQRNFFAKIRKYTENREHILEKLKIYGKSGTYFGELKKCTVPNSPYFLKNQPKIKLERKSLNQK
jgi:hypothetical protein